MESSGPLGIAEIALMIVAFALTAALVAGIFFSIERGGASARVLLARFTPTRLAEAAVVPEGIVELRARAVQGSHKIWLECDAPSGVGRWSAVANVAHGATTPGGYREASPEGSATKEAPIAFGEDGDGPTIIGANPARRTGALSIPLGVGRAAVQLVTLAPCPEGAEIYVRVAISALSAPSVAFRAFVGASEL